MLDDHPAELHQGRDCWCKREEGADHQRSKSNGAKGRPAEEVKKFQKYVGEMLWLMTRSRPNICFSVARMGANVLKSPEAIEQAYNQLRGYLLKTQSEGLCFRTQEGEQAQITVFTDASFAPHGQESHGAFLVKLGNSPVFWRSRRQSFVTLSTAECELTEIIEGMIAGESIAALVQDLRPDIVKEVLTDSSSALAILTTDDGGSWRTRHLRLPAAFARLAINRGQRAIRHVAGDVMIADIGTKPLAAVRLERLEIFLGMAELWKFEEEQEEKENEEKENEEKEKREDKEKTNLRLQQATQVMRLIVIAATLQESKAEEDEDEEEERLRIRYKVVEVSFELLIRLHVPRHCLHSDGEVDLEVSRDWLG